jgi:hypothetical protein
MSATGSNEAKSCSPSTARTFCKAYPTSSGRPALALLNANLKRLTETLKGGGGAQKGVD